MLDNNEFLRPLFPISLRRKHTVRRGSILAVLGSTDCLTGMTGYAAFLPFPIRLGRAGVGRTRPYTADSFGVDFAVGLSKWSKDGMTPGREPVLYC